MGLYEDFDEQKQFACRVIADHARTTAFAIADGILPGNEGRNYVLRKIMRRAIYHGREHLGFEGLFFHKVCDFVVGQMKDAYPELQTQREFIGKMVKLEEERFGNTLSVGLSKINSLFASQLKELTEKVSEPMKEATEKLLKPRQDKWQEIAKELSRPMGEASEKLTKGLSDQMKASMINFKELAKLNDTFGLPKDLIRLKLQEKIGVIEEVEFNEEFESAIQEIQSQGNIGKTQQNEKINPIYKALERQGFASNFHGYELTKVEDAKVVAIVRSKSVASALADESGDDGENAVAHANATDKIEKVNELNEGEEGLIVLDETPFYAESGGQVGDRGTLVKSVPSALADVSSDDAEDSFAHANGTDKTTNKFANIQVIDTFAPIAGIVLHKSKVKSGTIKVGDSVTASVDVEKRDAIRRNHTATDFVHSALKEALGTHVKQAGSVVSPNYLRFDFTHYQAMSDAELQEIEDLVNLYILQNEPVATDLMSIDDAMKTGAVAMFGEKYGSDVRVLSVGNGEFSKELCGGTHVRATGDIGLFKITADEAIASGVRRIRAITGIDAFKRFRDDEILIDESLNVLNTQRDNLPNAIAKLQDELKQKRKEVDELKLKIATGAVGGPSSDDEAKEISGVKVMAKSVEDLDKGGMRHLSDTLMAKVKSGVVIIGNKNDGKVSFIVRVSDDLTKKVRAGNIIKEIAPIVGGRGGGRPDMAEGGGTEPEKLSEAMDASYGVIEKMLE